MKAFLKCFVLGLSFLILAACRPAPSPSVSSPTAAGTLATAPSLSPVADGEQAAQPAASLPAGAQPSATQAATATSAPVAPTVTQAPPTPTARAVSRFPIVGVEMHRLEDAGGLSLVQQSGAYWVRRNALLWSQVEPEPGQRQWPAEMDAELRRAAEAGMNVILIVRHTPAWAQSMPGVACSPPKPEAFQAFAAFMHDAVARYSRPPYNVLFWEIGNEPDILAGMVESESIFGCWGQPDDPYYGGGYYAEMLQALYPAIKQANPQAQVLVGGLLMDCDPLNPPETSPGSGVPKDCTPSRYLEGILENGGGDFFDGVSFHAYDFYAGREGTFGSLNWQSTWSTTGPVLISKARYLRNLLARYGVTDKYLFNSENALICVGEESMCTSPEFQTTKAYYAARAYASALAEGLDANVWFSVSGWRNSGLVDRQRQPLPVYEALAFSATQLNTARYLDPVEGFPGIGGYAFERDGRQVWLLWSQDGEAHSLRWPETPQALYDVFGRPLAVEPETVITLAPLWVEWAP